MTDYEKLDDKYVKLVEDRLEAIGLIKLKDIIMENKCVIESNFIFTCVANIDWENPAIQILGYNTDFELLVNALESLDYHQNILEDYNVYLSNHDILKNILPKKSFYHHKKRKINFYDAKNFKKAKDIIYKINTNLTNLQQIYYDGTNVFCKNKQLYMACLKNRICITSLKGSKIKDNTQWMVELVRLDMLSKAGYFVDFRNSYKTIKKKNNIFFTEWNRIVLKDYPVLIPYFHTRINNKVIFGYNINLNNTLPTKVKEIIKYEIFSVPSFEGKSISEPDSEFYNQRLLQLNLSLPEDITYNISKTLSDPDSDLDIESTSGYSFFNRIYEILTTQKFTRDFEHERKEVDEVMKKYIYKYYNENKTLSGKRKPLYKMDTDTKIKFLKELIIVLQNTKTYSRGCIEKFNALLNAFIKLGSVDNKDEIYKLHSILEDLKDSDSLIFTKKIDGFVLAPTIKLTKRNGQFFNNNDEYYNFYDIEQLLLNKYKINEKLEEKKKKKKKKKY